MIQTEALAIPQAREDDVQAFEGLVRRYDRQLYNIALRLTGNGEEAKDLAQEALLRAYRSFASFKLGTSFEKWLYRIAVNVYIDSLRKRRLPEEPLDEAATPGGEWQEGFQDSSFNPELACVAKELEEKIQEALLSLPPEYRIAVTLCDIQGFSYEEISQILRCPVGTVRSRIHRARKLLSARLRPYVKEEAG